MRHGGSVQVVRDVHYRRSFGERHGHKWSRNIATSVCIGERVHILGFYAVPNDRKEFITGSRGYFSVCNIYFECTTCQYKLEHDRLQRCQHCLGPFFDDGQDTAADTHDGRRRRVRLGAGHHAMVAKRLLNEYYTNV